MRVLFLCVCASAASVRLVAQCPDGSPPPCPRVRAAQPALIISPFENRSRDTADTYLAATLTEDVTSALAASHAVRLLARVNGRAAEYRLTGSVRRDNGVERVSARLERTASGEIVWTTTLDRGGSTIPVADQLARLVLQRLGVRGPAGAAGATTARPVDPVAFELYRRGRYFAHRRTQADISSGLELLARAVTRDSSFALAWAEIATTLSGVYTWHIPIPFIPADSVLARELDASTRALLADSSRSEVWAARGTALFDVEPTSRTAAIRAFRRAIALDSLDASAWNNLGFALQNAGDTAASRRALLRSLALDPVSPSALVNLSLQFYWNRQYDSAGVFADSALAVDPAYISGYRMAGTVALARGAYAAAEAQFEGARHIGPGGERVWSLAGIAVAAAARGDSARAKALVAEMESLTNASSPSLHNAIFIAWGYASLGERGRALDWLERFNPVGNLHFQRHLLDGPLDPLRNEPRFRALMQP